MAIFWQGKHWVEWENSTRWVEALFFSSPSGLIEFQRKQQALASVRLAQPTVYTSGSLLLAHNIITPNKSPLKYFEISDVNKMLRETAKIDKNAAKKGSPQANPRKEPSHWVKLGDALCSNSLSWAARSPSGASYENESLVRTRLLGASMLSIRLASSKFGISDEAHNSRWYNIVQIFHGL